MLNRTQRLENLLLKSGQPSSNHVYKTRDSFGLKLLTRLRLDLSYLDEHRFNHNFDSCINTSCVFAALKLNHQNKFSYTNIRKTLLNTVEIIDESILILIRLKRRSNRPLWCSFLCNILKAHPSFITFGEFT